MKLYKKLSELWEKASMHAQKWILIESKVLKEIPEEDKTMEVNFKYGCEFPSVKTFGILWNAKEDVFTFKEARAPFYKESEYSKRNFLKNIATLFNLFGFLSPYVVQGKALLQKIWMTGLDLDEVVENIRNIMNLS